MSNPYGINEEESDEIVVYDQYSLTEHPEYEEVLRIVLWGDPKEEIYEIMEIRNMSKILTEALYERAMKVRVRLVRDAAMKKAGVGLIYSVVSVGTFCLIFFGLGMIPKILVAICFFFLMLGCWKITDGIFSYFTASMKKGPVGLLI